MAVDEPHVESTLVGGSWQLSLHRGVILIGLCMAGCAGIERTPQPEIAAVPASPVVPASVDPVVPPTTVAASAPAAPQRVAVKPPVASIPAPPAKPASPPPPAAVPAKKEPAAPTIVAKPEAPPQLDLKSLETRLKATNGIGVFTKITIKNQVDDLLDQFRAFHDGRLKTSLVALRRSFDQLVMKVLALLQDADPPLATAIASSRESIWGILSNPAKFSAI